MLSLGWGMEWGETWDVDGELGADQIVYEAGLLWTGRS